MKGIFPQKPASGTSRATILETILGLPHESPTDVLVVVNAGGPVIEVEAAPVKQAHVIDLQTGDRTLRLTTQAMGTLDTFRWTTAVAPSPRQILSHGRLLEDLPTLLGVLEARLRIVLSVDSWNAALDFLRDHGPFGMPLGFAILADTPVDQAPAPAIEALVDGATVTLADSARAQRVIGGTESPGQTNLDALGARFADIACEAGLITATLTCTAALPAGASIIARQGANPVAIGQPRPLDSTGRSFSVELELPRSVLFDTSVPSVTLHLGAVDLGRARIRTDLPSRRHINAEELLDADPRATTAPCGRKPFGILLTSQMRTDSELVVLESLARQDALPLVEFWMDGDHGNPAVQSRLDEAQQRIEDLGVDTFRRHRGALGPDKLMLHALFHMCTAYDRFVMLDENCFPTENAVTHLQSALDQHAGSPDVLTVYGSHFRVPCETATCPQFQRRGWGTWSDRLLPVLQQLAYLYSLPEPTYLNWVDSVLTPDIAAAVDCAAPLRATDTLRRFFKWDETLCLLAAVHGLVHAPTAIRCIHEFALDDASEHPAEMDRYREPPFNMILRDEVWENFHEPTQS